MSAWKNAERQVAKILGGTRRIRVQYSESCEDVHHTQYAIEVKWGKQIPSWIAKAIGIGETVLVYYSLWDRVVIFPLQDHPLSLSRDKMTKKIMRKRKKFLHDGLLQAQSYSSKIPLLCLKPRGYRGIIGCMWVRDYVRAISYDRRG